MASLRALENRVPPAMVMTVVGAIMYLASRMMDGMRFEGSIAIALGTAVTLLASYFLAAGIREFVKLKTTVDPIHPENASSLVDSGVYRISRNPMYVGFALYLVAFAFFIESPLMIVFVAVYVLYMNKYQIEPEERVMTEIFGATYLRYQQSVRRWL